MIELDFTTRDRLLRRIGLQRLPSADGNGLREVHRAFLSRVPYEDLAVQLGEYAPLDERALVERLLHGGRGGYCFEANAVFSALLNALGFEVERHEGLVAERGAHLRGEPTNHMALVVRTAAGEEFIADAGLGEGPLDPLPLRSGTVVAGAFEFQIERHRAGWWVAQHPYGSIPGFWFSDAPAPLAAFQPHHLRLSTSPDSSFVRTLVVQRPYDERIVTLRARTLFVDGPERRSRHILENEAAFSAVLRDQFGIDPGALTPAQLAQLWSNACRQHADHESNRPERRDGLLI